ncbi:unnamed protein product, partial [Prunus brigantina]
MHFQYKSNSKQAHHLNIFYPNPITISTHGFCTSGRGNALIALAQTMDRQAFRIETSFMAAMDRFSTELRTLFQEGMPV